MTLNSEFEWRGRTVSWNRAGSGPPLVFVTARPGRRCSGSLSPTRSVPNSLCTCGTCPATGSRPHVVDLGTQGELFRDLLNHWDLDSPHVVAHDFGGAVSLRAHPLHGASYASLTLVDVVALRPWGSDYFRLVADHPKVFAAQTQAVHRGAVEAYVAGASHRGLTAVQMDALAAPWLSPEGQGAFYRQIAAADERSTDEIEGPVRRAEPAGKRHLGT